MEDVEEIILYFRSLKKGYDNNLFQYKLEELQSVVDNGAMNYEEFHTLFKVWLNLSIPVNKWMNIGLCVVPGEKVQPHTVQYALRWFLVNYQMQQFSRIAFLLEWLTAALNSDCIDLESLDLGYELFFSCLKFEMLTPYALKLVYALSKPVDVNRTRVLHLLQLTKERDAQKSKARQIYLLLRLFKSYKPECVPETIPPISIHSAFKKLKQKLVERFQKSHQNYLDNMDKEGFKLNWNVYVNDQRGRNGKVDPLIPNMKFMKTSDENCKNFLHFTESRQLLSHSLNHAVSRPARLRSMLANDTATTLLAVAPGDAHTFLSHDLRHVLQQCMQSRSPYKYNEIEHLLSRLAHFQRTLMQGVPVVTVFLAQYLPFWNGIDYFPEILELVQWLSLDLILELPFILFPLATIFYCSEPLQRCAILKALTNLYSNMVYLSTRQQQYFLDLERPAHFSEFMRTLLEFIGDLNSKMLQVAPNSMIAMYSSTSSLEDTIRAELRCDPARMVAPPALTIALPMLSMSATLLDKVALLLTLYMQMYKKIKRTSPDENLRQQSKMLQQYTADYISALWDEKWLSENTEGFILKHIRPDLIRRLQERVPNAHSCYGLGSHYALAPYTYIYLAEHIDGISFDPKDNTIFINVITREFTNIKTFYSRCIRS